MNHLVTLFFRITNRLFAFFMDYLGRVLRKSRRLELNSTVRKRLLVIRQGGFGDLLFISAIIAELKRQHPLLTIDLMCHPQYQPAFEYNTTVGRLLDHRWPSLPHLVNYDYFAFLDGVIECDAAANTTNVYDLFAEKYFGLHMPDSAKVPLVDIAPSHRVDVQRKQPALAGEKLKIGLQIYANSPVRTPSETFWNRVIERLLQRFPDADLFLLVEQHHAQTCQQWVDRVNARQGRMRLFSLAGVATNVGQLAALVSLMDAIVAPDSSVIHLAAAFRLPAVGIYGPFPSALRTRYYRRTLAVDAPMPCAPCFTHGHWPCREAKRIGQINSPCFDRISDAALDEALAHLATQLLAPPEHHPGAEAPCPVCASAAPALDVVDFNKSCEERLGKYLPVSGKGVAYHLCPNCGFCFAPELCAWDTATFRERIYNSGYIDCDPDFSGARNTANAKMILDRFGEGRGRTHLDFGGGSGGLTQLLRRHGWESISYDPFQPATSRPPAGSQFDLITAFEVFEHTPSPQQLFTDLRSYCHPATLLLASTLVSNGHLHHRLRIDWWYAAPRNGHIALYACRTLDRLASQHGFSVQHISPSLHLFTPTDTCLSPQAGKIAGVNQREL